MNFYTAPSSMAGGFTVYGGYRRQRGAGVLGSFRKFMAPVGRQALSGIKSFARNKTVQQIAKQAAAKGAEVLTGVAVDALQGRNIGESLKERSRDAALRTLTGAPAAPAPAPAPAAAAAAPSRGRKKMHGKRLKQKKRLPSSKVLSQAPARKKRRCTASRAALNRRDLF